MRARCLRGRFPSFTLKNWKASARRSAAEFKEFECERSPRMRERNTSAWDALAIAKGRQARGRINGRMQ